VADKKAPAKRKRMSKAAVDQRVKETEATVTTKQLTAIEGFPKLLEALGSMSVDLGPVLEGLDKLVTITAEGGGLSPAIEGLTEAIRSNRVDSDLITQLLAEIKENTQARQHAWRIGIARDDRGLSTEMILTQHRV